MTKTATRTGHFAPEFCANARASHSATTPALNAESETNGRFFPPVLDFGEPPLACWRKAKLDGRLFERQAPLSPDRMEVHGDGRSNELNIPSSRSVQK
jgi:hypothetical protein